MNKNYKGLQKIELTYETLDIERIVHDIIRGERFEFIGGRGSGKTTLKLKILCELYDKIAFMQWKTSLKTPHALVFNPITFNKLKPQLLSIKQPMNVPLQERFNGIPIYTSPKVLLNICRIAWSPKELEQILQGKEVVKLIPKKRGENN